MKSKFRLIIFVILLVLGIGVGYAMLSSNLKIVGSSGIKSGKWIIYFDRIQNESGVVSTNTKITNNKTQVDFNIALTKPGDYYEFDVDTVNDGTIDAMIDSVEFGDIDDSLKDIITFDVTYKDGTEIQKCDVLPKESRRTITVKVNYEYDIDKREILNEETNMNLTFTINYVQDSVCEQYPTLIVDPNGGKYNGTKKLTKLKVEKNSDTVLNVPTRDGYEFLYFENEDNTPLEKDDEGKTTVHVGDTDKKVTAVWEEDNGPKYILTIDPNGGIYDGKSENTIVGLSEGKTLTLEDPIKDGYIFAGWEEVTETAALSGSTVTMPALAVTVKAIWKTEADYVARIENRYYETIQKAYDAAVNGDKVWLLKSTTENATNIKNISFDLGGFTVTGTITNTGTLTIDNGKIQNTESSPFVNIGTVNVGTHDGNMIADSIIIDAGEDVNGLTQNGTFNFYDGYIIGKIAVTDIYNELEEGYYYIVDSLTNNDETKHWQKAYLSPTIDAIVKKIINNRDVYYKLLQDGVDASTNDNPNIYAIKNFPDSHQTVIGENQIILFDICGFNIDEGAAIINNGTLTITDSAETKGSMIVREAIVNNGTLSISDISLSQGDTGKNLLENSGNLNVTNSTLIGTDKYALDIKTGGNLVFDNSTTIRADEYGIYNESSEAVTITGGNIVGVYNDGDNLTIKNSSIVNGADLTIYSSGGNLVLDNITANYTRNSNYLLRIEGGEASIINGNYDASGTGVILVKRATLGIDGAILTAAGMGINADNSTVTFTSGEITSGSYSVQNGGTSAFYINGGKMKSTGSHTLFLFSGTVYVNGGEVVNNYNVATTIDNDYDGNVVINGGLVKAEGNKLALYCNSRSSATINGGTIISTGATAIYNNRTLTVTGGTIIGANYGIENDEKLIIGNNSDEVKTDSPIIRGETYGVYSTDTMSFYDGILEGKTDGYYGTITAVPSNYEVVKGTVEIEGVTYNEEHLAVKKDFLQVGNTKFNSLQAAIDSIDGEGTILVIADSNINEASTIPNTKTINFDLNGHKLLSTETITNNGTLNLKDSVLNSVGEFASYNVNLITNNKNVEFLSGNYKSNYSVLYQNNSSAVSTISGGYLLSTGGATVRNANGTLVVNDGEIEENTNANAIWGTVTINGGYIHSVGDAINGSVTLNGGKVYSPSRIAIVGGTLTIHAGEISTDSGTGILCGTCTIDGGKISSKTGTSIFSNSGSRVTISDGEFTSLSGKAFSGGRSSRIDISGGLFKSIDGNAYRDDSYSTPVITGGRFISENSTAIYLTDGSGFKLEDAYVEGKVYGVYINHSGFNFVLGKEGEGVVTNTPVVIGGSEGVHIVSGNFDFYDGIVKGVDNSYNTTIRKVEDSYVIKDDTEVIEGVTYKTAYPGPETDFLEVNGQTYNSLKKAINAIETTGTIKVIENKVINSASTIDSGKNITLDLNGKELTLYQSITNQGIFTVVDNGTDGKLSSFATTAIDNKGTLNITSGIYDVSQKLVTNTTSGTTITISDVEITANGNVLDISNSTFNISNVTITANSGYAIVTKNSTVTADNINITTGGNGIYNEGTGFTISNSTITSSGDSFGSSGGETLTNCNFTSTDNSSINRNSHSGTLTINSGIYTGKGYSLNQNTGNTQVNGGTFISSSNKCFYVNTGVVTIGNDDSTIDVTSPVIQGETYGIYTVNNPIIYFYDGIIKGKTSVSSSQLVNIATDSFIKYGTEVIGDNTYNTAYLLRNVDFIENQSTHDRFNNFNDALTAASNNDELKLIDNGSLFYDVEIPNKKLTLNMNNYKIDTIKTFVNNGDLTIIDTSSEKGGSFSTTVNISMIKNNNKLSISDTTITASNSNQYMILNTTSGSVLSLDNVTINSTYSIDNTQNVSVTNSNISSIKNNTGTVSVDGSTINTSMNALYNYNGILSVTNSSATSTTVGGSTHYAYYNNVTDENILKNTIDKTNLYSGSYGNSIGNANGTLEVKNQSNVYKGFNNQANLNVLNSYISSSNNDNISNSGILVIDSSTTDFSRFTNSGTATFDDSTLNCVKYDGDMTYIRNNGDMILSSSTINSTNAKTVIANTSNLNINSSNIIADYTSRTDVKGIDNSGIVNLNSGSVEIKNAGTVYGVYLTGGFVDVKNFEINVHDCKNSYGIYVQNGTLTLGENENPLNVSTTTPLISAVGTTSGIGVKKISGEIYYYDGKIIGSTDAQPEAPTALASSRYRRVFTRDVNDYETCILEYVP